MQVAAEKAAREAAAKRAAREAEERQRLEAERARQQVHLFYNPSPPFYVVLCLHLLLDMLPGRILRSTA